MPARTSGIKKDTVDKLLKLYNIGIEGGREVLPTKRTRLQRGVEFGFEEFPAPVQKIWNYWKTQTYRNAASYVNRKLLYNDCDLMFYCVSANTKLLTQEHGTVEIGKVVGESLHVLNSKKEWVEATIKHYGKGTTYPVVFQRRDYEQIKTVFCTLNHRWRVSTGEFIETQHLGKGAEIPCINITHGKDTTHEPWKFVGIMEEDPLIEDVYCAEVPSTNDFVLEDGLLTGNSNTIVNRVMNLAADEVVQADSNFNIIDVEAQPKLKNHILALFKRLRIDKLIRPTALALCRFGNAGWVLSTSNLGIDEILPIDVYDLLDRIEFTPHEIKKQMLQGQQDNLIGRMSQNSKMKILIDSVMEQGMDAASYFKTYLFGFQVGFDFILPPWKFLHFRNFTPESPFYPFGVPPFIHMIAPYRQYDAALSLQVAARGARFPIYKYKLHFPNAANITEKMDKALEFVDEFNNAGLHTTRKEDIGIGERIITIDGLYDFEQETPDIDLGRIDDIEMMKDDLIIAAGIPRNFIDANATGFGNSGVALIQQFKPFARFVYSLQSIILENVTQLVKIDCILSGKFTEEELEFQLTMPYPESQTDREMIGSQSDLVDLFNKILDTLAQRIAGDAGAILPPELVRSIATQILPYDTDRIDEWVNLALITRQEGQSEQEAGAGGEEAGAPGGGAPGGGGGPIGGGGPEAGGAPGEEAGGSPGEEAPPEEEEGEETPEAIEAGAPEAE